MLQLLTLHQILLKLRKYIEIFLWVMNFKLRIELYLETMQMTPSLETLYLFQETPSLDNLRNADHSSVPHPFRTHLRDLELRPQEL